MIDQSDVFWRKAEQSLAGAEAAFQAERYDNCANRCYYACFQAAVSALMSVGIAPAGRSGIWTHEFVQSRFTGELINRRKLVPGELRAVLPDVLGRRQKADYQTEYVTEREAHRALRAARALLAAVHAVRSRQP